MILEIIQQPNPILREKSHKVEKVTAQIKELAENMLQTMYKFHGIGLAAPQVGQPVRLIVFDPSHDKNMPSALLNPEIVSHSKQQDEKIEGCLSCQGFQGKVMRYSKVTVKGKSLDGKAVKFKAEGLLARVLQHEIDHLQGIIIMDKAVPVTPEEAEEMEPEVDGNII